MLRIESGQFDVFQGRCARQQVKTLKHKPDFLIANVRELVLWSLETCDPVEQILA